MHVNEFKHENCLFYFFHLYRYFILIGPLTETHLPIDTLTKKLKGFAFITYMMPEHAVRAFTFLDGTSFMVSMWFLIKLSGEVR